MNKQDKNIAFIDLSKAVAALCVSICHFIYHSDHTGKLIENPSWMLKGFTNLIESTVFVFFVISGFAIAGHLESARYKLSSLPRFLGKRMIRIYFPFLLCMICYIVLEMFFAWHNHQPMPFDWSQFLSNLTFTADLAGQKWYNPVFWTLAIEVQFYIFIATLYPVFKLLEEKKLIIFSLLILLSAPFLIPDNRLVFKYLPLICLGYILFLERKQSISLPFCLVACGLSCIISAYFLGLFLGIVLVIFTLLLLFLKMQTFNNFFSRMTYSYYLFHGLSGGTFLYFTARYVNSGWMAALLVVLAISISMAVSYAVFILIERPSVNWSKKWIRYKRESEIH